MDGRAGADLKSSGFDVRVGHPGDIYLTKPGLSVQRIIGFDNDGVHQSCPTFSPDGSKLAYVETAWDDVEAARETENQAVATSRSWAIVITELNPAGDPAGADQRIAVVAPSAHSAPCAEWSPEGVRLAYVLGTELWIAALGEQPKAIFTELPEGLGWFNSTDQFEWSPEGTSIAVTTDSTIQIVPVDGGEPSLVARGSAQEQFSALAWSPDGSQIAVGGTILTQSPGGGTSANTSFVRVYAVDGFGDNDAPFDKLSIADAGLTDSPGLGGPPAWSPDGRHIAFPQHNHHPSPWGGLHHTLVLAASDGSERVTLRHEVPEVPDLEPWSGVVWSPDGERLIYVGFEKGGGLAVVSVSIDPEEAAVLLTPLTGAFYSEYANSQNLSWQSVFP